MTMELPDIDEENAKLSNGNDLPDIDEANALAGGELPDIDEVNRSIAPPTWESGDGGAATMPEGQTNQWGGNLRNEGRKPLIRRDENGKVSGYSTTTSMLVQDRDGKIAVIPRSLTARSCHRKMPSGTTPRRASIGARPTTRIRRARWRVPSTTSTRSPMARDGTTTSTSIGMKWAMR